MNPPLSRLQKFFAAAAGLHLVLVIGGACSFDFGEKLGFASRPVAMYASLSGADSGYGFFAPGVGSQLRARFDIVTSTGTQTQTLERGTSKEADLRVGNILGWFWNETADRSLQRSLAASWAGKMYGRLPDAQKVVVRLETYSLPNMTDYQKGVRPEWKHFYDATFVRKPKTAKEGPRA